MLIVEDVLTIIDLAPIRDSIVGSAEKRGISGGQKKRVNIGLELVAYPRVLFLDEPTSGLDSAASLQVARCLQRMRNLGITVVTVIHQPRVTVFNCFSHCLLLAKGGRTVFLGPTEHIQGYLESQGFVLPKEENLADWFIDVTCNVIPQNINGAVNKAFNAVKDLPELWNKNGAAYLEQHMNDRKGASGASEGDAKKTICQNPTRACRVGASDQYGDRDERGRVGVTLPAERRGRGTQRRGQSV